jgi:hypothetical protein
MTTYIRECEYDNGVFKFIFTKTSSVHTEETSNIIMRVIDPITGRIWEKIIDTSVVNDMISTSKKQDLKRMYTISLDELYSMLHAFCCDGQQKEFNLIFPKSYNCHTLIITLNYYRDIDYYDANNFLVYMFDLDLINTDDEQSIEETDIEQKDDQFTEKINTFAKLENENNELKEKLQEMINNNAKITLDYTVLNNTIELQKTQLTANLSITERSLSKSERGRKKKLTLKTELILLQSRISSLENERSIMKATNYDLRTKLVELSFDNESLHKKLIDAESSLTDSYDEYNKLNTKYGQLHDSTNTVYQILKKAKHNESNNVH